MIKFKTMTLISVIVPCYNQAQYLDECLQSVLDQTYTDWECIIVNDGSPDNTEEVAKKWVEKDPRFKYLYKENGGLSSARNAGIEIAKGEWILPLDADDKIGERYLELAEKEFENGYTIIYCEAEFFGVKNGKWELPEFSKKELAFQNVIFCSAFFKKENWQSIGGYDIYLKNGWEDWEFWINYINNTDNDVQVLRIKKTCFFYRVKEQSMITNFHETQNSVIRYNTLNYIYQKHNAFFKKELGFYQDIIINLRKIQKERDFYKKAYLSKRYKVGDKIVSFLNFFLNKK